jgi:hypothetical protein
MAASMKFRFVFWDVLPCKIIVVRGFRGATSIIALMMEAARASQTSVDNYITRQYIPEDKSEQIPSIYLFSYCVTMKVMEVMKYSRMIMNDTSIVQGFNSKPTFLSPWYKL